jgi:16S rRNA (uracil1498-N3)-methyltransferase
MQVFYSNNIINTAIFIEGQEHVHLTKVLRKSEGDEVAICNGSGLMLSARIVSISKKQTVLEKIEILAQEKVNTNKLILAVAPTKNIDRYQWMIEKCTEIGISKIIPFYSKHSERRRLKLDRLQLIALSAMKQSKSLFLPEIIEPISFKDLLKMESVKQKGLAYMEEETTSIAKLISNLNRKEELLIAIGPEGGFSEEEVQQAKTNGFAPISLGSKRLRTETAAVYSAVAYQLL